MAVAFCHAQPSNGSYVVYARSHVCMPAPAKEGTVTGSQASVHRREKRETGDGLIASPAARPDLCHARVI
uniref:Uncharacterized protein n=1 Tax=Aegilops tauschii subsp. strangulata TaxID=200361 RepID=A0A452Y5V5_AEGTS